MPLESNHFACPCCGYLMFSEGTHDTYEICRICFWEDDPVQYGKPDFEGGANRPSLRQAQANFAEFGACEREAMRHARAPGANDRRASTWKPLPPH